MMINQFVVFKIYKLSELIEIKLIIKERFEIINNLTK